MTNISVIVEKSNKVPSTAASRAFLEQLGYLLGVQSYSKLARGWFRREQGVQRLRSRRQHALGEG